MSDDPTYPKDAAIGDAPGAAKASEPEPQNETLAAAMVAKQAADAAGKPRSNTSSFVRGAAVGVGSAALVAALLYANRSRKDKA